MRKFFEWFRSPEGWGLALVYLVSAAAIAAGTALLVLSPEGEAWEIISYIAYALMAVCAGYCVYTFVLFGVRGYSRLCERSPLVRKLRQDFVFRTLTFAVLGCAVSVLMAAYYWTLFGLTLAVWYGTLAGYYLVLACSRTGLLLSKRRGMRRGEEERKAEIRDTAGYLASGGLLVLLSLTFSGVIVLTVIKGEHLEYAGLTIYVAALYAFLKIILASVNLVKAGKRDDFTVRSLRSVSIADALVSIVALQAAMLQTFMSEGEALDPAVMNAATGGIAGVLIIAMGSYMIIKGYRRLCALKESRAEEENGKE